MSGPLYPAVLEEAPTERASATYDENGVDRSLIRWMLALTPDERLAYAESSLRLLESVRREPAR